MALKDVIAKEPRKAFMLANEAIVRGALEKDVKIVSFYPGSPTVEILETFEGALAQKDAPFDYRMEISVNEKVALETIAGASMVGLRSMTAMKSVGTNVASDALYTIAYTGVRAGCLMVMADDPHAHSSQSEQDGSPRPRRRPTL
jgi:indolepyruvate ferredoxin oxidoreductase alpha subunit